MHRFTYFKASKTYFVKNTILILLVCGILLYYKRLMATFINYFFARNKYNEQDARHKYFLIAVAI